MSRFFKLNDHQIKVQEVWFRAIQEKYVQKDKDGNFLIDGENATRKWKFITSKADLVNARVLDVSMVEKAFNEECQAFFDQSIQINS